MPLMGLKGGGDAIVVNKSIVEVNGKRGDETCSSET